MVNWSRGQFGGSGRDRGRLLDATTSWHSPSSPDAESPESPPAASTEEGRRQRRRYGPDDWALKLLMDARFCRAVRCLTAATCCSRRRNPTGTPNRFFSAPASFVPERGGGAKALPIWRLSRGGVPLRGDAISQELFGRRRAGGGHLVGAVRGTTMSQTWAKRSSSTWGRGRHPGAHCCTRLRVASRCANAGGDGVRREIAGSSSRRSGRPVRDRDRGNLACSRMSWP